MKEVVKYTTEIQKRKNFDSEFLVRDWFYAITVR